MKKLKSEKNKPNPNRKEKAFLFRYGYETDADLEFLKAFYPDWSMGKIIRTCLAAVAKQHQKDSK